MSAQKSASVVGVGTTAWGNFPETDALGLGVQAFKQALDDSGLAVGDIDGDGKPDMILVDAGAEGPDTSVYLNKGGGKIGNALPATLGSNISVADLQLADMNNDGKREIISADFTGYKVRVHKNAGGNSFPSYTELPFNAMTVLALDLDGDGNRDIVASEGTIVAALGRGDLSFRPAIQIAPNGIGAGGTQQPRSMVAGDLNGDNKPDLISTNNLDTVYVLLNTSQ